MIDPKTFYARRDICSACSNWKGVCLKGHALSTPVGCPERKFAPVEGASYMEDHPVVTPETPVVKACCGGAGADVRELTYAEAAKAFAADMKIWAAAGFPLLSAAQYSARISVCSACPGGHYKWYQCRLCKCIMMSKAKLATTDCMAGYWPKV